MMSIDEALEVMVAGANVQTLASVGELTLEPSYRVTLS